MPAVLSSAAATAARVEPGAADCGRLLVLFELVPDPRRARGVRHRLPGLLAVAAAAVLAGCRSVRAVAEWAAEAPQQVLAALGARYDARAGRCRAPCEDTFRRVLGAVDAAAVDQVIGIFLTEHAGPGAPGRGWREQQQPAGPALAVDGKTVRGARQRGGRALHLLAAMPHDVPAVLAQREVPPQTNEITQVKPLLEHLELTGRVVTLDALHCQQATARHLAEDKGAHYVFTAVKDNQAGLLGRLAALPWPQVPIGHASAGRGHGRQETRTIQVLPAPAGLFPHAAQAFLIRRTVRNLDGAPLSQAVSIGLTSLPPGQASPERLAGYARGHWAIENQLHWVRDTAFAEDHAQLRTGSAPHVLAALRNLAIGALHAAGQHKITASLRAISRNPIRVLAILGEPP
jgi:predicted transposase YbfD/YdcC